MFFLVNRGFIAGRRDGRLKSTKSRLLLVLALGADDMLAAILVEDHVGCETAARRINLSNVANVIRDLPLLARGFLVPKTFILASPFETADCEIFKISAILLLLLSSRKASKQWRSCLCGALERTLRKRPQASNSQVKVIQKKVNVQNCTLRVCITLFRI